MKPKKRGGCVVFLIWVIASLLILDFLLYHLDPTGAVAYFSDQEILFHETLYASDGYRFVPGIYHLRAFTVSIGLDGLRQVDIQPPVNTTCKIAFLGDSVTFGWGSNRTFADMLADELPDVTFINGGLPGYGAANIRAELDSIKADGYIWLIFPNDDDGFMKRIYIPNQSSATLIYLANLTKPGWAPVKEQSFVTDTRAVVERSDVLAFVFADKRLTDIVQREFPQVKIIPYYTDMVSRTDEHPSVIGHQQIAQSMHDAMMEFVNRRCHEE